MASEIGLRASYVDGVYYPAVQWPCPGTAEIVTLPDQGEALALRGMRQARAEYEACKFERAAERFEEAAAALQRLAREAERERGTFDPRQSVSESLTKQADRARRQARLCRACGHWLAAAHDHALEGFQDAHVEPPPQVRELGRLWPNLRGKEPYHLSRRLLEQPPTVVLTHLVDAWHWTRRWGKKNLLREAFLRYFSLGEFALEALFIHLRRAGKLRIAGKGRSKFAPVDVLQNKDLMFVIGGITKLQDLLTRGILSNQVWRHGSNRHLIEFRLIGLPTRARLERWFERRVIELRNACTHKLGEVDPAEVDGLAQRVRKLLPSIAERLDEPDLARRVKGWLDGSPDFEPPPLEEVR